MSFLFPILNSGSGQKLKSGNFPHNCKGAETISVQSVFLKKSVKAALMFKRSSA
jgi:hypothetical protein